MQLNTITDISYTYNTDLKWHNGNAPQIILKNIANKLIYCEITMQIDEVLKDKTVIFNFENYVLQRGRFDIRLFGLNIADANAPADNKLLCSENNRDAFYINSISTKAGAIYHGVLVVFLS